MEISESVGRKRYMLFPADTSRGWRVVRMVSLAQGLRKVDDGVWREERDPVSCELIGFRILGAAAAAGDREVKSLASSASITSREMQINAGCMGRSQTAWLDEIARQERAAARRLPEDRVERVQAKVAVYAAIGSKRGDILRVWPK